MQSISLTDRYIKDTYQGVIHAQGIPLTGNGIITTLYDGVGNMTSLSIGQSGAGANITGSLSTTNVYATLSTTTSYLSCSSNAFVGGSIVINGNTTIGGTTIVGSNLYTTLSTNTGYLMCNNNATISGALTVGGNIFGKQDVYAYYSDRTLKTDLKSLNSGEVIDNISGYEFTWNDKAHELLRGEKSYGVIAQDVEKVAPHAVFCDENGLLKVNYQMIIPFLLEEIKSLKQRIVNLEKSI